MIEGHKTPYEDIGEEKLFELIDLFYSKVSKHPELKPIFPADMTETARKQKQFMSQYLGGPPLYTNEHGHPMLRARHMPFEVTPGRADAWLSCMREAMDEAGLESEIREFFYHRLALTAQHMINTPENDAKGDNS